MKVPIELGPNAQAYLDSHINDGEGVLDYFSEQLEKSFANQEEAQKSPPDYSDLKALIKEAVNEALGDAQIVTAKEEKPILKITTVTDDKPIDLGDLDAFGDLFK